MRLRILTPLETVIDAEATKVTAEAVDGWFCMLPRHVDVVTTLVSGVLVYEDTDGHEAFIAVDEAVLVKCGDEVLVSTPRAVTGAPLGDLQRTVEEVYRVLDIRDVGARTAIRRLEATFLRGLIDLEEARRG